MKCMSRDFTINAMAYNDREGVIDAFGGIEDLRLEEFELPEIKEDEILVKVMSDSICMSTYKLAEMSLNISKII